MKPASDEVLRTVVAAVRPAYEIPHDDLVGEVLIPAMRCAQTILIGAGFFSSRCLAQIAPGLAALLQKPSSKIRLLTSPAISSEDRAAIESGVTNAESVMNAAATELLLEARRSGNATDGHCLSCLAYLVASERLEIRFVLMDAGMYHKKKWLLRQGDDWLAVHGSGNATHRGLLVNGEQMTIDRAWKDGDAARKRVDIFVNQFLRQWKNESEGSLTVPAHQALDFLRRHVRSGDDVPTVEDFWAAWEADFQAGIEVPLPPNARRPRNVRKLRIPADLHWRTGRFAHQGVAVDSFLEMGRGIFSIATGGGKTKASLISAALLQDRFDGAFLLLVLAPSRPLVNQWAAEVLSFGVHPSVLSGATVKARRRELEVIEAALRSGKAHTEVVIGTNQMYGGDEPLRAWLDRIGMRVSTMLIADEVHNFGTPSFLKHRPETVKYRLGLSATPIRQYDPVGTSGLADYFGDVLIEFTIGDAIEAGCLVPYDYYVHEVELTDEEAERYSDLTAQLRRLGFRVDDEGQVMNLTPRTERILRERRAIVEQAGNKLGHLRNMLEAVDVSALRRSLVYVSAKPTVLGRPRQIELVNGLLAELGIVSHQFTNVETSSADGQRILTAFGQGDYQMLTAMRVLDEGVDIPQTETAYLLASSSVEREWVQRRGRVLRSWSGKEHATLHDFVATPPDSPDDTGRSLLRAELRRVTEFVIYSRNEFDRGGGDEAIRRLERRLQRSS